MLCRIADTPVPCVMKSATVMSMEPPSTGIRMPCEQSTAGLKFTRRNLVPQPRRSMIHTSLLSSLACFAPCIKMLHDGSTALTSSLIPLHLHHGPSSPTTAGGISSGPSSIHDWDRTGSSRPHSTHQLCKLVIIPSLAPCFSASLRTFIGIIPGTFILGTCTLNLIPRVPGSTLHILTLMLPFIVSPRIGRYCARSTRRRRIPSLPLALPHEPIRFRDALPRLRRR
jgi:hypothetical protein